MFVSQMTTYQYFPFVVIKSHPFVIHDLSPNMTFHLTFNTRIGGVMVSLLASSVVDRGFDQRL
jgi:hypothetical protein